MKKKQGFTLIELLVVIAIIGILSSVVLASLNSARTKARDAKRVSDVKQIQLALEMYYDDHTNYPTVVSLDLLGSYLPTIPKDPLTLVDYQYFALGSGTTCSSYHIIATLENASNSVLDSDSDAVAGTTCTDSATPDVDGLDASNFYDVTP